MSSVPPPLDQWRSSHSAAAILLSALLLLSIIAMPVAAPPVPIDEQRVSPGVLGAHDSGADYLQPIADGENKIGTPELLTAIGDWRTGHIGVPVLLDAIDFWRTGESVVQTEMELHHLDVGQADSTLIITPAGETILIDTGGWRQAGTEVISYLEDLGIDRIDHMVATHGQADHIGGHAAVIEWAETQGNGIGAVYDSGVAHTSQTYADYLDTIDEHNVDFLTVAEGDQLPINDPEVDALVVNPEAGDSGDDLHENSVSLVIEKGAFAYVTTGDAEGTAEQRMVTEWGSDLDEEVYQVGHHGSRTSSNDAFLDTVTPDMAVISSDDDSQYGHPHEDVLQALRDRDVTTYWTGVHGNIVITTDGTSTRVKTETAFSTDPDDMLTETRDAQVTEISVRQLPRTSGKPAIA